MILGRPTNLWLGFVTAFVGLASVSAVTIFNADPEVVATLSGGVVGLLGALVALIAGGTPTVNSGDTVNVVTPKGQDNYQTVA